MNDARRELSIEFFEPSEFIGAWSPVTECYAPRLPRRACADQPRPLNAYADAALALSAVAFIFSIPLLIMFVTVR
jgi:hypothetical protein